MVASGPSGAYEALQLYRSRATRLRTKNDQRGAIQVIVAGSKCLLTNGYENAGAELVLLLLDVLNDSNTGASSAATHHTESDSELRTLVGDLEKAFPPASRHRIELLKGCVKWTVKHGNRDYGDPAMHTILARALWENAEHTQAVYHFAAGEAPDTFCHLLESTFSGYVRCLSARVIVYSSYLTRDMNNFLYFMCLAELLKFSPVFHSLMNVIALQRGQCDEA